MSVTLLRRINPGSRPFWLACLFVTSAACQPKVEAVEPQLPIAQIPDMHITGQAAYRERIALQSGAFFEAVLADVSRADASANVIARTSRTLGGEQAPLPFELIVKQHLVKTNLRYAVRVTITGPDGRLA